MSWIRTATIYVPHFTCRTPLRVSIIILILQVEKLNWRPTPGWRKGAFTRALRPWPNFSRTVLMQRKKLNWSKYLKYFASMIFYCEMNQMKRLITLNFLRKITFFLVQSLHQHGDFRVIRKSPESLLCLKHDWYIKQMIQLHNTHTHTHNSF